MRLIFNRRSERATEALGINFISRQSGGDWRSVWDHVQVIRYTLTTTLLAHRLLLLLLLLLTQPPRRQVCLHCTALISGVLTLSLSLSLSLSTVCQSHDIVWTLPLSTVLTAVLLLRWVELQAGMPRTLLHLPTVTSHSTPVVILVHCCRQWVPTNIVIVHL